MDMSKQKEQRVAVFVDVQNLYYSAKNLFGAKVDFGRVLNIAVGGRRLVRAFTYVIKADVGAEKEFFEALNKIGYEVKMKDLQTFYDGSKKGDWDVGLCMDVVRMVPKIDAMVLVSGDGDYIELLKYAQSQGVRTEVMAYSQTASGKLVETADFMLDMASVPGKFLIGRPALSRGRVTSLGGGQQPLQQTTPSGSPTILATAPAAKPQP